MTVKAISYKTGKRHYTVQMRTQHGVKRVRVPSMLGFETAVESAVDQILGRRGSCLVETKWYETPGCSPTAIAELEV